MAKSADRISADRPGPVVAVSPPGRTADALDRRIIRLLQVNGRMSNTDVAKALDVTETTVRKRVASLLEDRLMTIVAVPTPEAAGLNLSAILGISVELQSLHSVAETIRTYREVRYVGLSAGRYDLVVEGFFVDQEQLLRFITERLGALPGITGLETSIILKVAKFSYEWEVV